MTSVTLAKVKSRGYALYDGFFYSLMVGASETYFSAFAVFLGANNFQLAVLASLPAFIAATTQLWSISILKRVKSRKKMVVAGVCIQALSLLPMVACFYLKPFRLDVFIILACIYTSANNMVGPIWNSWMADLVEPKQRGKYFAKRNRFVTLGTYLALSASGLTLRYFQAHEITIWGFFIVFTLASSFRFVSALMLSKQFDPPSPFIPQKREHFLSFLKTLPKRPAGHLMIYMGCVNFSVFLSAGYFAPYLLKTLGWGFGTYTLVIGGLTLAKFVSSPLWGKIVDQLGAKTVLSVTGFLIGVVTIPWAFVTAPFGIFALQVYSGFAWAGWELSSFTLMMEAVPSANRTQDMSHFSVFNGICALAGGLVGSQLLEYGPVLFSQFGTVYLTSSLFRLIFIVLFAHKISELPLKSVISSAKIIFEATIFKTAFGGIQFRPIIFAPTKRTRGSRGGGVQKTSLTPVEPKDRLPISPESPVGDHTPPSL